MSSEPKRKESSQKSLGCKNILWMDLRNFITWENYIIK